MSIKTKQKQKKKKELLPQNLPFWVNNKPKSLTSLRKKNFEVINCQRFNEIPKHILIQQIGKHITTKAKARRKK